MSDAPKTMADLLAQVGDLPRLPQRGTMVKGKVSHKTKSTLFVDVGGKTEGVVADKEFHLAKEYIEQLNPGDEIEAYVISSENDRGQILMSLKKAAEDTKWSDFEAALKDNKTMGVKGVEVNKGGLIVALDNVRGFIPTSQFGRAVANNLSKLKGKQIQVKVIEVDREKNRLIFSERYVSEAEELSLKGAALATVTEGHELDGVVTGVMPFGAFISVTLHVTEPEAKDVAVEGLVHVSELSWKKIGSPHDLLKPGQAVKVKVLSVDTAAGKLNLSIKQLTPDPWQEVEAKYSLGSVVTGVVTRVASFGVFVQIEEGVDGLIHSSKLSPGDTYNPGQEVQVTIEEIDSKQHRISLSPVLTEVPVGYK
jgi:small subunit ribosomal protein S1